jgi:hypothetical protein
MLALPVHHILLDLITLIIIIIIIIIITTTTTITTTTIIIIICEEYKLRSSSYKFLHTLVTSFSQVETCNPS